MDKLDQATLFSPEAGRNVVDLAKDIHVFTVHDFYKANKGRPTDGGRRYRLWVASVQKALGPIFCHLTNRILDYLV